MLPSNINSYKQLCASLHYFHEERYYNSDFCAPSKADLHAPGTTSHLMGLSPYRLAGSTSGLMDYWISRHFSLLARDIGQDRMPRPVFPLVRNVVGSKAVAFREQVTVELVDRVTGRKLTPDDLFVAGTLERRLRETGWFSAMRAKEQAAVLYRTAGSWYRIADGEVVIQVLPPYAFDAEAWEAAPSDPARARRIVVPAYGDALVDPDHEPAFIYERIPGAPATYLAGLFDPKGELIADLPEAPRGISQVGTHPVVIWREGQPNGLFAPPPLSLYYAQVDLLLELIYATIAVRLGAHGTLAITRQSPSAPDPLRMATPGYDTLSQGTDAAADPDPIRYGGGVQSILQVPDGWQASMLQSRVNPIDYAKWVQAKIRLSYLAEEMAPGQIDLVEAPPSNVSGKARLAEQMPRILAKSRREAQLRENALADLEVWRAYWNFVAPEQEQIPETVGFRVTFSELWSSDVLTDQATVQAIDGASRLGLMDLVELRQQIDNSSYEDARTATFAAAGRRGRIDQYSNPDAVVASE